MFSASQRTELPGCLGRRSVGVLKSSGRLGQPVPRLLLVLQRRRELPLGPLAPVLGVADLRRGLVGGGAQAQQALLAGRATTGPVHAEHVAACCHDSQPRVGPQHADGVGHVRDDHHVAEQARDRAAKIGRCTHKINSVSNVADSGRRRQLCEVVREPGSPNIRRLPLSTRGDHQTGPSSVVAAQPGQNGGG